MFKPRYALIWVCVSLFVMYCISWVLEGAVLREEARTVQNLTVLASDMALQAGQGIDDFFATEDMPANVVSINHRANMKDVNTMSIYVQERKGDGSYTEYDNLLTWYLKRKGQTIAENTTLHMVKEKAFTYLYGQVLEHTSINSPEFKAFADKSCYCTTTIPYIYEDGGVQVTRWVTVPRVALIGCRRIWKNESEYRDTLLQTNATSETDIYSENSIVLGWGALMQNKYDVGVKDSVFGQYYLTPSKLGLSYINRDLVETLYQNNLDLLMRANLDNVSDGDGFAESHFNIRSDAIKTGMQTAEGAIDAEADIINNGVLTIRKSSSTISKIEYMVLDVFDANNNDMIEQIYGAAVDYDSVSDTFSTPYIMTAQKLKAKSTVMTPAFRGTLIKPTHYYITVAKVTFTLDAVLQYKTGVFTTWRTENYDGGINFNDLVRKNESQSLEQMSVDKVSDSPKYKYTRYYVVTS